MRCPECGFDYPIGHRYCGQCGARVASTCENCGYANPLEYRFCGQCGVRLAETLQRAVQWEAEESRAEAGAETTAEIVVVEEAEPAWEFATTGQPADERKERPETRPSLLQLEGERRTATVILADVQGSTDLFEQIGTEAWVRMMNRVFQILETEIYRYGGEVDQFRGDGLVALWGATSVHEDDPERAILAALAMLSALEPYAAELASEYSTSGGLPTRRGPTSGGRSVANGSGQAKADAAPRLRGASAIDLKLRIGINTGEVIVASIGDSRRHSEDTAMGEAIALAARMESAAEPGTVLVSDNTYQLAQARFEWQALGKISVKGVSRPVAVYRPLGLRAGGNARSLRLETYGLSSLLIGREREFSALNASVQALRDGHGGVVLLVGSEGMGKSHLVERVRQHVARDEALLAETDSALRPRPAPTPTRGPHPPTQRRRGRGTWLWGQCHSYEQTWPYSVWLDMGRRWLGVREAEPSTEVRERLRQQCEALWGEQMAEYYPYLARMLSLPLEEPFAQWVDGLGAEALRQAFFLSVLSWVEAVAANGPLVLVFEDVHWADAASLALLEHCLPLCDRMGVLWVVMTRPLPGQEGFVAASDAERVAQAQNAGALGMQDLCRRFGASYPHRLTSLSLLPLTKDESGEMIDRLIGPDALPPETRALLIEKADGNPYYIEELIRSLIRTGVLVQDEGTCAWRVSADAQLDDSHPTPDASSGIDLPDTLRSLLLAGMDDLAPEERRVLQVAAVIGAVFWENVLQELVGSECDIAKCVAALERAQFVRRVGRVPHLGTEYHFASSLIRDAAYEGMLSVQRIRYHRQVAEHLARPSGDGILAQYYGLVAYHFRCAHERRRELFYTLSAAEHAQEIYANAEALEYYTRALKLLQALDQEEAASLGRLGDDWRLETLRGLGQVCYGAARIVEAEGYLREAIRLAQEMGADEAHPLAVAERVRLYYWLGETLHWQRRHEEQIEIAQEGLALLAQEAGAAEAPESVETALMNQEIAVGYLGLGDHARFQEYTRRTAGFLENLPYSEELRPAYDHVAMMYAYDKKDLAEAKRWLEALERSATLYHDLRALGDVNYSAAGILNHSGDSHGAVSRLHKALEIFDRIGDAKQKVWCLSRLGDIYLSLGDLVAAREYAQTELEAAEKAKSQEAIAYAYWRIGQIEVCEGAWEEAADTFQESARIFYEAGARWNKGGALYALGRVLMAQGKRAEAIERYQAAIEQVDLELLSQNTRSLALVLSAAEEAYQDVEQFQDLCARWREQYPSLTASPLVQWRLEPAEIDDEAFGPAPAFRDDLGEVLSESWVWHDPMDDCWFRVREGFEVHAANRRTLWHINLSAPRVLRQCHSDGASGDLAVQSVCSRVTGEGAGDAPASGGLLMWADAGNYLRLDVGTGGAREVFFGGCIGNVDLVAGRGGLPRPESADEPPGHAPSWLTGEVHLRLERVGKRVRALCSLDGAAWFSVGQVEFAVPDRLQVGLYANGEIDRLIYPGAYPGGTEIRFGSFEMWGGL